MRWFWGPITPLLAVLWTSPARASGVFAGAEAGLMMTSMRPVEDEKTPNYGGASLGLVVGYSFFSDWNAKLKAEFAKKKPDGIGLFSGDGRFLGLGTGVSMNLGRSASIGVSAHWVQLALPLIDADDQDLGLNSWRGGLYGLSLGRAVELSHDWMLEFALQYRLGSVRARSTLGELAEAPQRSVDTFSLTMTYLWKRSNYRRGWLY